MNRAIKRREFFRLLAGVAAVAAASTSVFTSVFTNLPARERFAYLDNEDWNYAEWRQTLKRLCEEGYDIRWCSLDAEQNGYRLATVHLRDSDDVLRFLQPWNHSSWEPRLLLWEMGRVLPTYLKRS